MLIKEIQELINSINHETSMGECYFSSGATIDGIKEAIVLSTIDKLVIENDLFYCNEEEVSRFFEKIRGQINNELLYGYSFGKTIYYLRDRGVNVIVLDFDGRYKYNNINTINCNDFKAFDNKLEDIMYNFCPF